MDTILDVELQIEQDDAIPKPVSIHCHSACNLIVWKSFVVEENQVDWDNIKKYVARLMDRLADLLHDYQQFAPLVALVELPVASSHWEKIMGDQDWHRGRFIMQAVKTYDGQNTEDVKRRWLGSLLTSQYTPRKILSEDFVKLLNDASKNAKPPKDADAQLFGRYVANLKLFLEKGTPHEMAQSWQNELMMDINSLLGKSILEDSNFG